MGEVKAHMSCVSLDKPGQQCLCMGDELIFFFSAAESESFLSLPELWAVWCRREHSL